MPLGAMEGTRYRDTQWSLNSGDGIFIYTDGVPEANSAAEELFGNERMIAALNHYAGESPEMVLKGMRKEVDRFVGGAPQFDDLTMLGLVWTPGAVPA